MTLLDRLGFHLRLKTQEGTPGTRIAFLQEVSSPAETRKVLVEITKQARNSDPKKTIRHTPVRDQIPSWTIISISVINCRMNFRHKLLFFQFLAAVATGILLRFVVGLHPIWWLVWFAPVPLLLVAFRFSSQEARWIVTLAAIIGTSGNFHYFRLVMPLPTVIAVIAAQSLLWAFLIMITRSVVVRYQAWWTVFVFPVFCVAADTLMAALLPDGNWASLAYSQANLLPILQITSLLGTAGLLFLLALVPSALALAIAYGRTLRDGWIAYGLTGLLLASSIIYGLVRLQSPANGVATTFGLASIDDAIGLKASPSYASDILQKYDKHVASLAARGAQVIVLPEKVALLTSPRALQWQQHFSALALQNHIWLEVGVGIFDGKSRMNWAWLFTPEGALASSYQKHHLAPPERRDRFSSGTDYAVHTVAGRSYGLAICKDMHFAALGRAYGQRHASVMLVPAFDFDYLDAWMEARTTVVRGIENGYAVVRSSREGFLTVSDAYGRILAERPSSAMPGSSLLATAIVANPLPTLYTRIGNFFGWLCVVAAAILLLLSRASVTAGAIAPHL
jgi:apolipoprotein N-acyltransferase